MKIVITGGMGFIFSHVTEYFIEKGYEVYVLDNLSFGSHPELLSSLYKLPNFHFYQIDVDNVKVVDIIKTVNPDYIVHAAAISDVDFSIKNPYQTITSNNEATLNVFEAARKCERLRRFLYVSTDEVYGECEYPKEEDEIIFPRNPYSLSKAFGSILRLAYDNTYPELKDKTCETRFCNVFGPRQDDRKIIPAIKRALDGGDPVILHNGGKGFRQYIYVKEIPPLIELLLERGHRTYNITSGEGYTVSQLIGMAEEHFWRKIPTIPGTRDGMDMRYEMSSYRLKKEFDWQPQYTFKESFVNYLADENF